MIIDLFLLLFFCLPAQ